MFIAAIAHHFFYSYTDVVKGDGANTSFVNAFLQSSMPTDVIQDVVDHTPHIKSFGSHGHRSSTGGASVTKTTSDTEHSTMNPLQTTTVV